MKRFKLDSKERAALGRREQKRIAVNISKALLFIWLIFFVLILRYAWIQLVRGEELAAQVRYETGEEKRMQSPRGAILDCNGREMAVSLMMKRVFIDPSNVPKGKEDEVAAKLAPLIGVTQEKVRHDIEQGGGYIVVKRFLTTDEVKAVQELIRSEGYNCIGFEDEPKRHYPNEDLAANILGFVGTDDVGLDGIEQAYDDLIKGVVAETFVQTDNVSDRPILGSVSRRVPKQNQCKTVQLTIDANVQFMVEEVLEEALAETQPLSVTALVMKPKTGEILAMASRPSYNPNHFEDYPMEVWKNRAVSSIYEPGSTFKSIVAAAALEEGMVSPNDWFMDPGYLIVSEKRIENWSGGSFGTVTFTDVMKQSINTCFALIGLDLGADRLNKYARRFGFGEVTGIELPGEEAGLLFDPAEQEVYDSDIATMSIGQSIAVTPLQLVTAMSAIANDGILMKPYIVKAVYNEDGSVYEETTPREVRRAISSETDKTLIGLLEQVVATGGGGKAQVKGYRIGGKTGTAQKINTEGVGYKEGCYIASFCGFAPVDDPEVTLLVIIDEPSGGNYYGGQIAAPVAAKIFQQLFRYLNVEPSSNPFEEKKPEVAAAVAPQTAAHATVPEVVGLDAAAAQARIQSAGLKMRAEGKGTAVSQDVAPYTVVEQGTEIVVRFAPEKDGT